MSNRTAFELFSHFFLTGRDQEARAPDRQYDAREAATVTAVIGRTRATDAKFNEMSRETLVRDPIH